MDEFGGISFKSEVDEIPIDRVRLNPLNPRKRFSETEEDELLGSIDSKGIINPVIVFERNGSFWLIDGQRRYEAAKKLKLETIPARVLEREPDELENLSLMFHIHNVAEDWTEMAVALTILRIINATGTREVRQLSRITSLSVYKIRKYLRILSFPDEILEKFAESERMEKPDLDVDFLAEIYTPIQRIEKWMPDILKKFSKEEIVNICIEKKKKEVIRKNKEFRNLGKIVLDARRGKLNARVAQEKIVEFLKSGEITIEAIYSETSEAIDQAKVIADLSVRLTDGIRNIDLGKVPRDEKRDLTSKLRKLLETIQVKIE